MTLALSLLAVEEQFGTVPCHLLVTGPTNTVVTTSLLPVRKRTVYITLPGCTAAVHWD